jgi:hypothetical protein
MLLRYSLGSVWAVTNAGAVVRLSRSGSQTAQLVAAGALDVKFNAGRVYVLTHSAIEQLDPATGRVQHRRSVTDPVSFDVRAGVAYVAHGSGASSAVDSVDVTTGRRASYHLPQPLSTQELADSIAVSGTDAVWVIDGNALLKLKINPLGLEHQYQLPFDATDLGVGAAGVFVATQNPEGGIVRLAQGASSVTSCWSHGDALQMVSDGADLWASAAAGLSEIDERTCRVVAEAAPVDESGTGVAVLPDQVWIAFPGAASIEVVAKR